MRGGSRAITLALAALLSACNAIVGIDSPEPFDQDGAAPTLDSGHLTDGGIHDANSPTDGTVADGTMPPMDGSPVDVGADVPPPPPGKPGMDLTAGGTYGKSGQYSLVAAVGESPGGNTVGKTSKYTLKAGVIAVTQP
jgi:hypothetical protein